MDWKALQDQKNTTTKGSSPTKKKVPSTQSKKSSSSTAPRKPRTSKYEKEVKALKAEVEQLRAEIDAIRAKPIDVAVLETLSEFTFNDARHLLLEKYDLTQFETQTVAGQKFFWKTENFKQEPSIAGDPQKLDIARLLNRIHRGDGRLYEIFFAELKKHFLSVVKAASTP